ncbi:hypothetical protein ACFWEJ_22310 [Promicromonospora sp. NPDC060204]
MSAQAPSGAAYAAGLADVARTCDLLRLVNDDVAGAAARLELLVEPA